MSLELTHATQRPLSGWLIDSADTGEDIFRQAIETTLRGLASQRPAPPRAVPDNVPPDGVHRSRADRGQEGRAGELTPDAIEWLIETYTDGVVPDYQMAAMAMAIFINGMSAAELAAWTRAMLHSGEVFDFSDIGAAKVDKHSTGGVGDKISIPLAPLVASVGVVVPMMSGRGLGHTGGTLDKLETIPGFTTRLDPDRFRDVVSTHGWFSPGRPRPWSRPTESSTPFATPPPRSPRCH